MIVSQNFELSISTYSLYHIDCIVYSILYTTIKEDHDGILSPVSIDCYHRVCLIIFRQEDKDFLNHLGTTDARDDMKDMFKKHKIDWEKENDSNDMQIMSIVREDLETIMELGNYVHYEPRLWSCLAYFYCILGNFDRSAEKINSTKLQDFEFKQWENLHYWMRNPTNIQKKISNQKTKRSFGIWVYIPGGPQNQPYNIITVSHN